MEYRMARSASVAAIAIAVAVTVAVMAADLAFGQSWPTKPVRVIVPFSPGSATDLVPRTVFDQVAAQVGQTIIIDNRAGGGTTVGTATVAKAEPDGHTLLAHSNGLVTTPAIQASVPYDPVADFAAITPLAVVPMVLVISPEKKITTLRQLVDMAKARPGTLNYAAAGIGTPPHLTMERFRIAAGFTGQLVPFRGAPEALTEVLAGRVDVYFAPAPPAIEFIRDGKLLALAVSSVRRAAALPDVPTTLEAGYKKSDYPFWTGLFVPAKTPREIVDKLAQETQKALAAPGVREKLAQQGMDPMPITPAAFDAQIRREIDSILALAKAANLKFN
jgi:tripartite-type tricarboxylate transporter receptor subunit TctC